MKYLLRLSNQNLGNEYTTVSTDKASFRVKIPAMLQKRCKVTVISGLVSALSNNGDAVIDTTRVEANQVLIMSNLNGQSLDSTTYSNCSLLGTVTFFEEKECGFFQNVEVPLGYMIMPPEIEISRMCYTQSNDYPVSLQRLFEPAQHLGTIEVVLSLEYDDEDNVN